MGPIRKQGMEELGVLTLEKRDSGAEAGAAVTLAVSKGKRRDDKALRPNSDCQNCPTMKRSAFRGSEQPIAGGMQEE